jgi:hypothetical protein
MRARLRGCTNDAGSPRNLAWRSKRLDRTA